jgi:hypothetical protein
MWFRKANWQKSTVLIIGFFLLFLRIIPTTPMVNCSCSRSLLMTKGTQIDGDEADRFPHAADELSASSPGRRIGGPVIPFTRRATVPPSPAAEASPPEASAPFEDLGSVTQAVVMRLANKRIRIRVAGPGARENDRDQL